MASPPDVSWVSDEGNLIPLGIGSRRGGALDHLAFGSPPYDDAMEFEDLLLDDAVAPVNVDDQSEQAAGGDSDEPVSSNICVFSERFLKTLNLSTILANLPHPSFITPIAHVCVCGVGNTNGCIIYTVYSKRHNDGHFFALLVSSSMHVRKFISLVL